MSTQKSNAASAVKLNTGFETKNGADKAAKTLQQPEEKEKVVHTPTEAKPTVEQILKRLPILNQLKSKLESIGDRIDLFQAARARWTGECETLTINFGKREGKDDIIVITNATGVGKCLDMLIAENERLAEKTKGEIENFTF